MDARKQGKSLQLVWVPGHAGVQENEDADQEANAGREMNQRRDSTPPPVDLSSARVAIRGACRRRWAGSYHTSVPPDHFHRKFSQGRPPKMDKSWSRREQVVLHQLRVNRCPLLRDTLRRWRRPGEDGLCEDCNEAEDSTHYLLDCARYQPARQRIFGPLPFISILQDDPDGVVRFIRATGLLRRPDNR